MKNPDSSPNFFVQDRQLVAGNLANVAIQGLLNVVFGAVANELFYHLSVLENQQGRNAGDFVAHGRGGVSVDVHFANLDFTLIFAGEFFDDGSDRAARATPGGPEIDQHGLIGLQYIGIKISVGNFDGGVACHSSSRVLSSAPGWTIWSPWGGTSILALLIGCSARAEVAGAAGSGDAGTERRRMVVFDGGFGSWS